MAISTVEYVTSSSTVKDIALIATEEVIDSVVAGESIEAAIAPDFGEGILWRRGKNIVRVVRELEKSSHHFIL